MSAGASIKNDSGRRSPATLQRPYGSRYLWFVDGVTYEQTTPGVGSGWEPLSASESDPLFSSSPAGLVTDDGLANEFLAGDGIYYPISTDPPNPLEIDAATVVGYVDTLNGDDANDGLTRDTAKQTLAACSVLPAGRIYAFGTGTYTNAVKLGYRTSLTPDTVRQWYFETGSTLFQTTINFLGDPISNFFDDVILAIEGNAIIRYVGNATSMIDSTFTFSAQCTITCLSYQYLGSGGSYPDANVLASDGLDVLSINATGGVGYQNNVDATNKFIVTRDTSFFKFLDVLEIYNRDGGNAQCSGRNATFYKTEGGGGGGNLPQFFLDATVTVIDPTTEFVRGESASTMEFHFDREFTSLGLAKIIIAGGDSNNLLSIRETKFGQSFRGHIDINAGQCNMVNVKWESFPSPPASFDHKIICRATGKLFVDNCDFTGIAGAIEAVSAGTTLEVRRSIVRAGATGDAIATESTSTRLWATALLSTTGDSVSSATPLLGVTMDQCIGDKALHVNIDDTIGNYVPDAGWSGL